MVIATGNAGLHGGGLLVVALTIKDRDVSEKSFVSKLAFGIIESSERPQGAFPSRRGDHTCITRDWT
jgi:hypothetical protein